jgi:hypothetical protein
MSRVGTIVHWKESVKHDVVKGASPFLTSPFFKRDQNLTLVELK